MAVSWAAGGSVGQCEDIEDWRESCSSGQRNAHEGSDPNAVVTIARCFETVCIEQIQRWIERRFAIKSKREIPPLVGGPDLRELLFSAGSPDFGRQPSSPHSMPIGHWGERGRQSRAKKVACHIKCAGWRTKSGGTPDKWWANRLENTPP